MDKIIHKLPVSVLGLTFVLMPFLAIAGGLGIAPVATLIGLVGWAILFRLGEFKTVISQPWFWCLSALLLWCFAAQFWSPYVPKELPSNATKLVIIMLSYCGIFTTFRVLKPETRDIFCHIIMAGGVFAAGLMLVEILSGYGLSLWVDPLNEGEIMHFRQFDSEKNLGRGILTYAQFIPAICLMFIGRFKCGFWVALAIIAALMTAGILNRVYLPPLIIGLTCFVMVLAWKFPRFSVMAVCFGLMAMILSGPLIGYLSSLMSDEQLLKIPLSLEHRIRMWAYGWERIAQNPWVGQGFDAARSYQDTFQERGGTTMVIVSLHPHNAAVQIWLEIGAIGAVLSAATLGALIKPALGFAQTPARASALAGTITAVSLFGLTTIGVWQYWWIGSIFIAISALQLLPHMLVFEDG